MSDPTAVKQLVKAAQALHAARLFERFSDEQGFVVRSPRLEEPALVALLGHGGQAFGLNVFLGGSQAMASYRAMVTARSESEAHRAMRGSRLLGYEMRPGNALSLDARRWLKKAGVRIERGVTYPDPMCLAPGKLPAMVLRDGQTRTMLHVVRGVLSAAREASFQPYGIGPGGRMVCVELDDSMEAPTARITSLVLGQPASEAASSTSSAAPRAARLDLSGLARSGDRWLVTMLAVPGSVRGDDRQPYMLVVASEQGEGLLPSLLMGNESADVVEALAKLMRDEAELPAKPGEAMTPPPAGLPDVLVLDGPELCAACRGTFEPVGVRCVNGSGDPGLRLMREDLQAMWGQGPDFEDEGAWTDRDGGVPADDDLDGWKRADAWLKQHLFVGFDHDRRFRGVRALRQYFGPGADPAALFTRFVDLMVVDSYAFWFAACYRSARTRETLCEQWLDADTTPAAVKVLVGALLGGAPSLYRVEEADEDTGKITLSDLFSGELTIATDFALSTCVEAGWVLPAWLVPAGAFHLYFPAGPLLAAGQLGLALDDFEALRFDPSPEAFRKQPHILGRLWEAVDQDRERPIQLFNTDGHPLLPHTAVFDCSKPQAFASSLAKQADLEPDGTSIEDWIWFRRDAGRIPKHVPQDAKLFETRQHASVGPVTVLAELHLSARGRLTVKVNSRERLDAARCRLEELGPLKLRFCQTHALSAPASSNIRSDRNDDPTQTQELDAEMLSATHGLIRDHYHRWLDESLPALGHHTPREAARMPGLRTRLAAMIRAMPDPIGPRGASDQMQAPRQMLLAELELE